MRRPEGVMCCMMTKGVSEEMSNSEEGTMPRKPVKKKKAGPRKVKMETPRRTALRMLYTTRMMMRLELRLRRDFRLA